MGTRGQIYLSLKEEDKGKSLKFSRRKLPKGVWKKENFKYAKYLEPVDIYTNATMITAKHNWDSDVKWLGKTLIEKYNNYDTALNVLLLGDFSTIVDEVIAYTPSEGEYHIANLIDYTGDLPAEYVVNWIGYAYWFKEGEWYVASGYEDNAKYGFYNKWRKLTEVIEQLNKEGKL